MSNDTLKVRLITPEKKRDPIDADYLQVMTSEGMIQILPHHCSYLANIVTSILTISINGQARHYAVDGGAIYVDNSSNTAYLLTSSIIDARDISEALAAKEKVEIERRLKSAKSKEEHNKAERELHSIINVMDVGNLYKE